MIILREGKSFKTSDSIESDRPGSTVTLFKTANFSKSIEYSDAKL